MSPRLSIREISERLADDIDAVACNLLGKPNRALSSRNGLRFGKKGSLSLVIRGAKRGKWFDHEAGEGGDPFGLVQRVIGRAIAREWALRWLGIEEAPARPRPATAAAAAVPPTAEPRQDAACAPPGSPPVSLPWLPASLHDPIAVAHAEVRERFLGWCSPAGESTPVARYLRGRGYTGPIPAALRDCGKPFGHCDDDGEAIFGLPYYQDGAETDFTAAMVAEITQPDETVAGVHVTHLRMDGSGKADVPSPKKMHGIKTGGAVRLTPAGATLAVTEGIETALSVLEAQPDLAVWAALDAGNIAKQLLPPVVRHVLICADNDASGTGLRTAQQAADRFLKDGRTVSIALPPETGTDFNDVLLKDGAAAVRALIEQAEPWDGTRAAEGARPHYAVPPMSVEAASAELKMEVAGFVEGGAILAEVRQAQAAAAHAALAAHPELDPEYAIAAAVSPVLIEERQKLLGQAKRDARKAVLAAHSLRRLPQRERLQVAAGAGIGKTQGVIDVIAAQKAPLVVYHYVPTHKLADGVATRYRQREVRTYVIRGRTAVGPDGQTMCRKAKLAEALGKAGRSVKKSLCKNEQGQCEHYGRCPFMRQVAEIETGERPTVIIMPHEYLTTPKPKGPLEKALPEADFAVVDETPLGALLAHKTLKLDDLGRPEHWQGVPESATGRMEDFLTTCRTIRGAFTEVNGTVRLSRVPRRLLDEIEAAAAFADEHAGAAYVAGLMGMDEDRAVALADRLEPSPRGAIARMLKTLVAERKLGRDVVHGIEVRGGEIHLRWRHRAKPGAEAVLAIDADAGEAFGRTIWGEDLRHVSLPVRRNAFVTQMNDSTFAKSSLLGGTTRDSQQTAARKLRKVRRFIADLVAVHGEGKVLAVANKPVRCRLTGEDQAGKLPAAGICGGAFVAHFGAIRGIDDWKDCACVVIIGREQLPVDTAEADARAFYWDDPEPLDLGHDGYTEEDRGYRMAAERAESAAARVHPDPRVQALHELKREREVGQAIDRLRLVHRKEPAQVYVLGSLVLDVTVDRLADFDDVLVEAGIAAALGRHGGVLPLGADWLMEHEPCVLVPNVHAERPAKRSLEVAIADMSRRVEAGALFANLKPQNSNRYLIENCGFKMEKPDRSSARPANDGAAGSDDGEGHPRAASSAKASAVRLVRYRLEGRRGGKPSVALVAADHADPAGALERVLGQQVGLVAGGPAAPNKAGIVLPAEVAAGVVMPFENVSAWERAARSEIVVRHRMSFPELAVWDAGGRPAGWHFGLPLPGRYWSGANEGEASAT